MNIIESFKSAITIKKEAEKKMSSILVHAGFFDIVPNDVLVFHTILERQDTKQSVIGQLSSRNVSYTIQKLIKLGYMEHKGKREDDGRFIKLVATEKGRNLLSCLSYDQQEKKKVDRVQSSSSPSIQGYHAMHSAFESMKNDIEQLKGEKHAIEVKG